jgi:hypothetical protein
LTLARTRALLRRPEYESWFFDVGDLSGAGVAGTADPRPPVAWYGAAARRLDTPSVRARVRSMTGHMAFWHQWNGEPEEAALCAALAARTDRGFSGHPLVRAMLEVAVKKGVPAAMDRGSRPSVMALGDEALRHRIKAELFADVREPTGRELARLDLTEAAWLLLDAMLVSLPGERRPREDDHLEIAHRLATAVAEELLGRSKRAAAKGRLAAVERLREVTGLPTVEADAFAEEALRALHGFVQGVCARCPVGCLRRPASDYSDVFFRDAHPAFGEDEGDAEVTLDDLHESPPRRPRRGPRR